MLGYFRSSFKSFFFWIQIKFWVVLFGIALWWYCYYACHYQANQVNISSLQRQENTGGVNFCWNGTQNVMLCTQKYPLPHCFFSEIWPVEVKKWFIDPCPFYPYSFRCLARLRIWPFFFQLHFTVHRQRTIAHVQTVGFLSYANTSSTSYHYVIHEESMGKFHGMVVIDHWSTVGDNDVLPWLHCWTWNLMEFDLWVCVREQLIVAMEIILVWKKKVSYIKRIRFSYIFRIISD